MRVNNGFKLFFFIYMCKYLQSFKLYRKHAADISKKNSESTLWSWNCLLPQSLLRNGKISVNFQPVFDWMNLPPPCTTWLPQVSGWCSVAWNKQIEKGTSWHLTPARMRLSASLPAPYNDDWCLLTKKMGGREKRGERYGGEGWKRAGKWEKDGFRELEMWRKWLGKRVAFQGFKMQKKVTPERNQR